MSAPYNYDAELASLLTAVNNDTHSTYHYDADLAKQLLSNAIKPESKIHIKSESQMHIKRENNMASTQPQSNTIKTDNPSNVEIERSYLNNAVENRDIKLDEGPYLNNAFARDVKSEAHHIASRSSSPQPPPISHERIAASIHKPISSKKAAAAQKKAKKKTNSKSRKKAKGTPENSRKRWTEEHDRSLLKWMRKNKNDLNNQVRIKGKAQHLGRTMIALTARINILKKKIDDPPKYSKKNKKQTKFINKQNDDDMKDDDGDEWLPSDESYTFEHEENTNNNNKKNNNKNRKQLSKKERKELLKKRKPVMDLLHNLKEIHQFQGYAMGHMQRVLESKNWCGDINTLKKYIGCDVNALQSQWDIMKNCIDVNLVGDKLLTNGPKKLAKRKRQMDEMLQSEKVYQSQNKRRRIN